MSSARLEAKYNRRTRLLYDACAGRVRNTVQDKYFIVEHEDMRAPVAADDILLELPRIDSVPVVDHKDLPNSDLLAAIHYYAAEYFRRSGQEEMFQAFDGTALIAMGVVLEERIKEIIGPNGHLCYAQMEEDEGDLDTDMRDVFVAAESDFIEAEIYEAAESSGSDTDSS